MKVAAITGQIFLLLCLLFGCADADNALDTTMATGNNVQTSDSLLPSLELSTYNQEEYVVVLFGYGYNDGEKKDSLLSSLDETYGLIQNGGIIIPFMYPDDFVSYGYERISLLPENIQEELLKYAGSESLESISTLVTLGAPDSTHYALARLQDENESIRIFSLFSQDDILGTEAGSTLVVDYSINQSNQQEGYGTLGEIDLSYPNDVFIVLSPLVNAGLEWDRIEKTGMFIPALRSEYTKKTDCDFFVYVDPQTGLRSENHYVLTEKE